jgi:hypothetical protein
VSVVASRQPPVSRRQSVVPIILLLASNFEGFLVTFYSRDDDVPIEEAFSRTYSI